MLYHVKRIFQGKRVLVVGSITPWIEALVLAANASQVDTLEYIPIENNHPKVFCEEVITF